MSPTTTPLHADGTPVSATACRRLLLVTVECPGRAEPAVVIVRHTASASTLGAQSDAASPGSEPHNAATLTLPDSGGWDSYVPLVVDTLQGMPGLMLHQDDAWSRIVVVMPNVSADVPEEITVEVERSGWLVKLSSTDAAHAAREFHVPHYLRGLGADVILLELLSLMFLGKRRYSSGELAQFRDPWRAW